MHPIQLRQRIENGTMKVYGAGNSLFFVAPKQLIGEAAEHELREVGRRSLLGLFMLGSEPAWV